MVKESGLLRRTPWFYGAVGLVLLLGFGGAITGFVLLGNSWFQLLIAGALGILFPRLKAPVFARRFTAAIAQELRALLRDALQ